MNVAVQEVLDKYKFKSKPFKSRCKQMILIIKNMSMRFQSIFEDTPASYLVDITHSKRRGRKAYSKGVGEVITKNAILNYFKEVSKVLKND